MLKVQGHNIDKALLAEAIIATSERRGSSNVLSDGEQILEEVFSSDTLYSHWTRYQKKYSYADDISWDEIGEAVFAMWNSLDF